MKTTFVAITLLLAAIATGGQLKHPSTPLTLDGKQMSIVHKEWPFPICPPACR